MSPLDIKKSTLRLMRNAVFVGCILLIFHALAGRFNLYTILPWSDIVSHILGGGVLGFTCYAFLIAVIRKRPRTMVFWLTWLGLVVLGTIAWEVAQYIFNEVRPYKVWALDDTIIDIIMGVLGALGALAWAERFSVYYQLGTHNMSDRKEQYDMDKDGGIELS